MNPTKKSFLDIVQLLTEEMQGKPEFQPIEQGLMPYLQVSSENLITVANLLKTHEALYFDLLNCITAIDNGPEKNTMELFYNFSSVVYGHEFCIRVMLPRNSQNSEIKGTFENFKGMEIPVAPTLSKLYKTADWHEREAFDFFGIWFENHPDLRRILLPADWEGFPMRKDYKEQEKYHGIKVVY